MPTINDMWQHVKTLLRQIQEGRPEDAGLMVQWVDDPSSVQVIRDRDNEVVEINLPHVRSAADYASCLHEIGHILGRYQRSRNTMTRERWAWAWAREHALTWSPDMESEERQSLQWYAERNEPES